MEKILFVYNPHAGRGVIRNHLSQIIELMCKNGSEVTIYSTESAGDARRIVSENGNRFDKVICSGGDGTLNEVTDGLMAIEKVIPCGYIPAGTVNDFAHSFSLPSAMVKAAEVAVSGTPFLCDIGDLNGDYFDYIAAFGAFTDVSYETPQLSKNILGKLAYFLEGVKRIPTLRKYTIQVEMEEESFEDEIIYGMITNSFSVGGFLSLFDDDVALDDGKFEAFFVKAPKNIVELQQIITALLASDVTCKYFRYYHVSSIKIKCEESISWTIDGEFGGEYKEVCVTNHQKAIPFIRGNVPLKNE